MIDWERILSANRIEFISGGKSTSRDNIYVHCPWCGSADQGHHLGISLKGKGWGCWRNSSHRGKSAVKLLAGLLGVSLARASSMLGISSGPAMTDDHNVADRVRQLWAGEAPEDKEGPLTFPKQIKPLLPIAAKGHDHPMTSYLKDRGYSNYSQRHDVCFQHDLHYALSGAFAYRLIFPVYNEAKELMTWTGRATNDDAGLRYMTLSTQPEKAEANNLPVAKEKITNLIFNEPNLYEDQGSLLIAMEGPFDAMRVEYATRIFKKRISATCLFGKAISDRQVDRLFRLADIYTRKVLILDPDAELDSLQVIDRLRPAGFTFKRLPSDQDPGEMSEGAIQSLIRELL